MLPPDPKTLIYIHTNHSIGSQFSRPLRHFFECIFSCFNHFSLIGTRTAAKDVAQPGRKVLRQSNQIKLHQDFS